MGGIIGILELDEVKVEKCVKILWTAAGSTCRFEETLLDDVMKK